MNKAAEKFYFDSIGQAWHGDMQQMFLFGIRCFCLEVERRADSKDDVSQTISRGKAFRELKRELLGGGGH